MMTFGEKPIKDMNDRLREIWDERRALEARKQEIVLTISGEVGTGAAYQQHPLYAELMAVGDAMVALNREENALYEGKEAYRDAKASGQQNYIQAGVAAYYVAMNR